MRVTTLQTSTSMLNYMTTTESKYYGLAEEAASGLKVTKPSDNSAATKSLLKIKEQLSELTGYSSSIKTAQSELTTTSSTLDSLTDLIQKASDYATQAANGTYQSSDLTDIKSQIDSLIQTAVGYSNTQFDGKYIFSGTATSAQTYTITTDPSTGTITDIKYNGTSSDEYQRYTTISDGVSVPINAKGSDVFGSYSTATPVVTDTVAGDTEGTTITYNGDGSTTIVKTTIDTSTNKTTRTTSTASGLLGDLMTFSTALGTNPPNTTAISETITKLNTDLDNVTSTATTLAGVSNRMDMTTNSIASTITNLKSYRSDLQDADITQVMTDLAIADNALQATYSVTSKILSSNSLLNYL